MSKRNTKQRRHHILRTIQNTGEVSVEALAKEYSASEVTIRKDLAALDDAGLVLRRYGGAVSIPKEKTESLTDDHLSVRKIAIAKAAFEQIKDHNRIVIDSGSTTRAMIPYLDTVQGLVVMTNSLSVVTELRELENEPTILMTGGTWDKRSESFQGMLAQKNLREYDFDQLFIGADGLDVSRGTTTYNEFTELSKAMAYASREVIVLAESSKAIRKIPNLELSWSEVNILVTDSDLSAADKSLITSTGVEVICAKVSEKE